LTISYLVMAAALAGSPVDAGPAVSTPPAPAVSASAPVTVEPTDGDGIVVTARGKPPPDDPLQNVNVQSFEVVQSVDRAVIGPVAHAYEHGLPILARTGVHNVLRELEEPTAFANFLLQHKVGKAAETLARFTINATLGLGGLMDVAKKKPFNLPFRRNGFGYTMGFYGIGSGPYIYLPLIGSTSLRDFSGRMMDLALLPTAVGVPFKGAAFSLTRGTLASIDDRVEMDAMIQELRDNSSDPYGSMKSYYQQLRQSEIDALRGKKTQKPALIVPAKPAQ
jgi:phospholipid-binding lipoprotein MlaA